MILLNGGSDSSHVQIIENGKKKKNKLSIVKVLLSFFVFVLLIGTTFWSAQWFWDKNAVLDVFSGSLETSAANIIESSVPIKPSILEKPLTLKNKEIEQFDIGAASAISVEIKDGQEAVLFGKLPNQKLPIASLAKLMTSLIVLEQYDLSQKVTVSQGAMNQEGDQGDLKLGQTFSVKDLLYITLIESSNKSAYALAGVMGNYKFVDMMNERARQLQLTGTYFVDSTGIRPGSRSTASDLVKLSRHLFENYPLFREIISLKEYELYLDNNEFHHKLVTTNKLLGEVPNVLGGKTGWTNIAKGSFMVIEKNPRRENYSIHVILGSEDRFEEMRKLISWSNH